PRSALLGARCCQAHTVWARRPGLSCPVPGIRYACSATNHAASTALANCQVPRRLRYERRGGRFQQGLLRIDHGLRAALEGVGDDAGGAATNLLLGGFPDGLVLLGG